MKYLVLVAICLGAVLLYLLATASANTSAFTERYPLLLALNGVIAALLLGLVIHQVLRLMRRVRRGVFGSRLARRLLLMFGLMALVPGLLVYVVSVQFLTRSIESWFDVRVERALEGGLNLGRTTLDNMLKDLNATAVSLSMGLAEQPSAEPLPLLNQLRERTGVQELALFDQRGKILAFSGGDRIALLPEFPDPSVLRQVRMQRAYSAVESIPDRGLYLRVLVPVNVLLPGEDLQVLQLLQPVPKQLAQDAETVQAVYRDYQELTLSRTGLKRLYRVTLTLSLLLALLSALLVAFIFSERLAAPLGILAEGTRAVAQGDFSRRQPVSSRDELGILTESFNAMTNQLAEARTAAESHQAEVERARSYLESILANLSSGVVTLDQEFRLRSFNPVAERILAVELAPLCGEPLADLAAKATELASLAQALQQGFGERRPGEWQRQVERESAGVKQVLLARATPLPQAAEGGYVVVFDDITGLLQAQRDAAWGEVARRLAHEIKNPLTPIQLSAERLQHKLSERLSGADAQVLARATQTIVAQVSAMKTMVDAFSKYARLPRTRLAPLDLNALVQEVLALYEGGGPRVVTDLAPGLPAVMADREQLGQVIHNLMRNAQDALAETPDPLITVATSAQPSAVTVSICDNGPGFAPEVRARAFEPYVTSKPRGTGLGLAIVKKIVEEHGGAVTLEVATPQGARVSVTLPAAGTRTSEVERRHGT